MRYRTPSPALILAVLALIVALAGTAGANPIAYVAKAISGKSLKKGTVTGDRLKKGTISGDRLKSNTLTGTQISESKLHQVPSAKKADTATSATSAASASHATTADTATNAASAGNANTLGGIGASGFVQGNGERTVDFRDSLGHNSPTPTRLVGIAQSGTLKMSCTNGDPGLTFVNDTGASTDTTVTAITNTAPHSTVDTLAAPLGPGASVGFTYPAQSWHIQAGLGFGRVQGADLDVQAFVHGTGCAFDVQGTSSLTLDFPQLF